MNSNRVVLRNDQWAELRSPEELTERGRRPIQKTISRISRDGSQLMAVMRSLPDDERKAKLDSGEIGMSAEDVEVMSELNDCVVVALVKAWSLSGPVTLDSLLDLHPADYDTLRDACAPQVAHFFPSLSEPSADLQSPTTPSNV